MKRTPLHRRTPIRPVNRERRKRLFERNFGDKAEWVRAQPCDVSGVGPEDGWPIEAAHVRHARGMGGCHGDKTDLVPLVKWVHHDFDTMSEWDFAQKYQRSKQSVKDRATYYDAAWQNYQRDMEAA